MAHNRHAAALAPYLHSAVMLMIVLYVSGAAGCAASKAVYKRGSGESWANIHGVRRAIVDSARDELGVPYRWGGETPARGFDCSGLVYYSYEQAGIRVPRTSARQLDEADPTNLSDARPGDLLFFAGTGKPTHVGIYIGNGKFIHSPSSGETVSTASLDNPYWQDAFYRAGRFVN